MIQNLNYVDGKINDFTNVDVIHSGSGKNNTWFVQKGNSKCLEYARHTKVGNFELRRLKVK